MHLPASSSSSLQLSIPFRMLLLHTYVGIFSGKLIFQFLLGCYFTCRGYPSRTALVFQFLLGCYLSRKHQYEDAYDFQFLLGCYHICEKMGLIDLLRLSIPFRMLRSITLHSTVKPSLFPFQFLLGCYGRLDIRPPAVLVKTFNSF